MAISYLSKVAPNSQYIQPFNLGLLQQINNYKQQSFYRNANALKEEYGAIQNSQIFNPEQKEHFTNKFNSMVQQIQELGPLNYEDANVTSQLQAAGSNIYNDPIVMQGISNTKKMMANQAGWEKINSDPKLMKYSAPQNQAWDEEEYKKYINGGLHATYNGSITPTVYQGNPFEKLTAKIKDLQPDITVGINPTTHEPYFLDSENKTLSPERIQALMDGLNDPALQNQIKIDGWYATQGMSNEDIFKQVDSHQAAILGSYDDAIAQVRQQQRVTLGDTSHLDQQLDQLQINRDAAAKGYDPQLVQQQLNTPEGRLHYTTNLYTKALFDDATTAYKYTQLSEKLQKLGATTTEQKNALKAKIPPNPFGANGAVLSEPATTFLNEEETAKQAITTTSLDNIITTSAQKRDQIFKDYFLRNNGGKYINYYQSIANLDGDPTFSINDLNVMHSDQAKLANLQLTSDAEQFYNNAWTALTLGQHNAGASLQNVKPELNLADAQQTMDAVRQVKIQQDWATTTKQKAYKDALNQKAAANGLTPAELEAYKRAAANPSKYFRVTNLGATQRAVFSTIPGLGALNSLQGNKDDTIVTPQPDSEEMKSAFAKLNITGKTGGRADVDLNKYLNLDEDVNKVLLQQSKAKTPQTIYLDSDAVAKSNPAAINLFTSGVGIIGADGEALTDIEVLGKDVEVTALQKVPFTSAQYENGNRYIVKYKYKAGKEVQTAYKYINGQQANTIFGVPTETENPLNDIFEAQNQLPPRNVVIPENALNGNTNLVQTQVVRRGNNPIQILFMLPGGRQTVALNRMDDGTPFTSAAQAEQYAENLSKTLVNYASTEQFLQKLNQYANTH